MKLKLFLILIISSKSFTLTSQNSSINSDTLKLLLSLFNELKIEDPNRSPFKNTPTKIYKNENKTTLELNVQNDSIYITKARSKNEKVESREQFIMPIYNIHHLEVKSSTEINFNKYLETRINLLFYSIDQRRRFIEQGLRLDGIKVPGKSRNYISFVSYSKEDLNTFIKIKGIIERIVNVLDRSHSNKWQKDAHFFQLNGNTVTFKEEVEIQPLLPPAKDVYESEKNLKAYLEKELGPEMSEQLSKISMWVVVGKKGKIIDVYYIDIFSYLEGKEMKSRPKAERKEYKKKVALEKKLKKRIKQILFSMPLWIPGKEKGENVNTIYCWIG